MKFKPYPKYKASGVEWLGEVPEGWDIARLKWSVQQSKGGVWGGEPIGDSNDMVCIRVADFNREQFNIEVSNLTTRNVSISEQNGRILAKGDLLLEKSGGGENQPVGTVVRYDQEFIAVCSNFINRLAPSALGSSNFFKYVHASLYAMRITTRSINQTSGIQNLDSDQYLCEKVIFPPLIEQSAIATFLDRETAKIDNLIAKQEALIDLLKEKRQAVISHSVTKGLDPSVPMKASGVEWLGDVPVHWSVEPVVYRYNVQLGKMLDSAKITGESLRPYLRVFDVQWGEINTEDLPQMDFDDNARSKFLLVAGDLLVNEGGSYPGRSAIWVGSIGECYYQKALHRLRANCPEKDSTLFMYYLMSWAANQGVFVAGGNGTTIDHLPAEKLNRYRFAFPPMIEQTNIVAFLKERLNVFDALIDKAQQAIVLQKEHRTALISAAVTGKIDVRNSIEERKAT